MPKKAAAKAAKPAAKKTTRKAPAAAPAEAKQEHADIQRAPQELTRLSKEDFNNAIARWLELRKAIAATCKPLVDEEMNLRKAIFRTAFLEPEEGTNMYDLGHGYKLKGVLKIDRDIDERLLPDALSKLPPGSEPFLIKNKPQLIVSAYRTLPADLRIVFDMCITEKPGSPQLEFIPPADSAS